GVRVEAHAEPTLVQPRHGLTELRDAARRGVPVVARVLGGLGELVDRDLRARQVRVAEAEVHDVAPRSACLDLEPVDDREDVGRQTGDPAELHRSAPALCGAPGRGVRTGRGSRRVRLPPDDAAARLATARGRSARQPDQPRLRAMRSSVATVRAYSSRLMPSAIRSRESDTASRRSWYASLPATVTDSAPSAPRAPQPRRTRSSISAATALAPPCPAPPAPVKGDSTPSTLVSSLTPSRMVLSTCQCRRVRPEWWKTPSKLSSMSRSTSLSQ